MSTMKKVLWLLLILLVIGVGVVFSLLNSQAITVDLFFVQTPPLNVSLVVFAGFAIGMLAGMILTSLSVVKTKVGARRQQKKLTRELSSSAT